MTVALEIKYFWEENPQNNAQLKIVKSALTIISVQNANQDFLLQTKTVNKSVNNATTPIALNVKTTLVIVKHVFSVTPYTSLNKSVKSQQYKIVSPLLMEDAKFVMMDTKLTLILPVKLIAK